MISDCCAAGTKQPVRVMSCHKLTLEAEHRLVQCELFLV